jgi:hypothetical protein
MMEPQERDERPVIHKLIERIQTSFCVGRRTERGHLAAQTELSFLAEWTRETCHRQGVLLSIVRGDAIAELEGNAVITRAPRSTDEITRLQAAGFRRRPLSETIVNLIEDLSTKEVIHRMRVSFLVGCDRAERGGVDPTDSEIGAVGAWTAEILYRYTLLATVASSDDARFRTPQAERTFDGYELIGQVLAGEKVCALCGPECVGLDPTLEEAEKLSAWLP